MKTRTFGGVLCAVVWSSALSQTGLSSGYLHHTGPVPLRFAAETPGLVDVKLPPLAMENDVHVPTTPMPPNEDGGVSTSPGKPTVAVAETNAAQSTVPDAMANQDPGAPPGLDGNPFEIPQPVSEPSMPAPPETAMATPASDLLVVTPQMLVDYFKPGLATTNAASMAVFVPLGFTPPAPTAVTPPSSSATYRMQ